MEENNFATVEGMRLLFVSKLLIMYKARNVSFFTNNYRDGNSNAKLLPLRKFK